MYLRSNECATPQTTSETLLEVKNHEVQTAVSLEHKTAPKTCSLCQVTLDKKFWIYYPFQKKIKIDKTE